MTETETRHERELDELRGRLKAAEAENERLRDALGCVNIHLDYLRETWGDEGVTRTVADRVKKELREPAKEGE